MIKTLQVYVTRELLKTFALTAVGLTLTFSLCGGIFNMIEADLLSSVQLLRMLLFILPVALTLTLPVAALFASAIVYGRLAADNEIDACKASGVNIYRLLAPALGLSIATAAFTYGFTNHILPRFVEGLDAMVRKDLEKVMIQALRSKGYIHRGPYVLYARTVNSAGEHDGAKRVAIDHAAFFELEGESLARCGTAQKVEVDFTAPKNANPRVEAWMFNVRGLDLMRQQFFQEEQQPFHSVEIPSFQKNELKWLTLPDLLYYGRNLVKLPAVQEQLRGIRTQIRDALFYKYVVDELTTGDKLLHLGDGRLSYAIRAKRVEQDPHDFRVTLHDVTIHEWRSDRAAGRPRARSNQPDREYVTGKVTLKVKRGLPGSPETAEIYLAEQTTLRDAREPGRDVVTKDRHLDEVVIAPTLLERETNMQDEEILEIQPGRTSAVALVKAEPEPLGLSSRIENARAGTRGEAAKLKLEIAGIVHSRLAFSASVLVMLILAAALGIIFRGGQLLTAFVISFAPALLVVVMNITGRQLAENLNMHFAGIGVIWGGILLLAVADVVVLTLFLRR